MALYKYVRENWRNSTETASGLQRARLVQWRKENSTVRVQYPTRLDRARSLGYRAKQGIFIVRQRVPRGGHRKPFPSGGRRSKKWTTRKALALSYQTIAEQRAAKQFVNCEPLNSYEVGVDGKHIWYEIIMIDLAHPAVKADPQLSQIIAKGRAFRGLTSSSKRSRGLMHKGLGAEKLRPSRGANKNRRKSEYHQ